MYSTKEIFPKPIIILTWISQGFAYLLAWAFFKLFFRVEVRGLEYVKNLDYGPVIYASNHVSDLDSVFIRTALPLFSKTTTLFAVCRESKNYSWSGWRRYVYSGWFFRMLGAYPANSGKQDYAKSLKTIVSIGKAGQTILIFIGGRQHSFDEPIKNRGGTAYLCWSTGLPVVPVAVNGTFDLTMYKILFTQPKVTIEFGPPQTKKELYPCTEPELGDFRNAGSVVVKQIEKMRNN